MQNTTIGTAYTDKKNGVTIGNNVDIGSNSCIIGDDIKIGDNVTIGAMSFINKDIAQNTIYITEKRSYTKPKNNKIINKS